MEHTLSRSREDTFIPVMTRILRASIVAAALLLYVAGTNEAQSQQVTLTPEQQTMLNQLPPAQRQQALKALRELESQRSSNARQTINEADSWPTEEREAEAPAEVELTPRAAARSRIILRFDPREDLSPGERRDLDADPVLQRLLGSHLFVLDDSGVLSLQGLELIPLLGLSEEDIVRRLGASSYLADFVIEARILGQEPIGVEALRPFGYDVFEPRDTSFEPPSSGPVPSN